MDMTTQANTLEDALDEQLAVQAKGGDSDALALLIQRYIPLVRLRAKTYCKGVLDEDDLFQEGMIGLINAIYRFDSGYHVPFTAFAKVCVDNKILAAVKRAGRLNRVPLDDSVPLDEADALAVLDVDSR